MSRIIFTNGLLFLIPFILYIGYIYFSQGRAAIKQSLTVKALGWLSVIGLAMSILVIVILTNYQGFAPGGNYEPAHIENGKVVPGTFSSQTPSD